MYPPAPQTLDDILNQAKSTLAGANAFNNQYVSDANQARLDSGALDDAETTHPLSDFLSGAWSGAKKNVASKFGDAAEGIAQTAIDPIGTVQRQAQDLGRKLAFDTPTSGVMDAAQAVTGLPLSSMAHDVSAGDWGDLAGDVGVGATLAALLHAGGVPAEDATLADNAVEPRTFAPSRPPAEPSTLPLPRTPVRVGSDVSPYGYGGDAAPQPITASLEPPSGLQPEPYASNTSSLSQLLTAPDGANGAHGFPVADAATQARLYTSSPDVDWANPTIADVPLDKIHATQDAVNPDAVQRWMTSPPQALTDIPSASYRGMTGDVPDAYLDENGNYILGNGTNRAVAARNLGQSTIQAIVHRMQSVAPAAASAPGDFSWDMSDFADQPAGTTVHDFTTDDNGSTVTADSPLQQLFKPRVSAAEAADNLRTQGSILGDQGPISRSSVFPEDEADASHRAGFYREDDALNNQWKNLLAGEKPIFRGGQSLPPEFADLNREAALEDIPTSSAAHGALEGEILGETAPAGVSGGLARAGDTAPTSDIDLDAAVADQSRGGYAPEPAMAGSGADAYQMPSDVAQGDALAQIQDLLKGESGSIDPSKLIPDADAARKIGMGTRAYQAASMLLSPFTTTRIAGSNLWSLLQKAGENAADARSFDPLTSAVRESIGSPVQMARDAAEGFMNPDTQSRFGAEARPSFSPKNPLSWGTRAIAGVDRAFRSAAQRAGMTPEEAMEVTRQNTPQTETGQKMLAAQQNSPFWSNVFPFVKAGINAAEQGIQQPLYAAGRIAQGVAGRADIAPSDLVKVGSALAAAPAAYGIEKGADATGAPSWLKNLFLDMGRYEYPATFGSELAKATNHDADGNPDVLGRVLTAAGHTVENLPIVGHGLGDFTNPAQLMGRVVPRGLNPDQYTGVKRDTTGSTAAKIEAQIPGLAQSLPVSAKSRLNALDSTLLTHFPQLAQLLGLGDVPF